MNVGIITYHRSQNYGAQLQAYALRRVVEKLGHRAAVLDGNTIGESGLFHWSCASGRALLGSLRNNILSLCFNRTRHRRFREFSQRLLGRTAPCMSRPALQRECAAYDAIITGSDQVWHPQICEGDTSFFLDIPIASHRKIAYAPSFGVSEYTPEQVARYMPLIADIAHLSVREESGQQLIRKHLQREAPLVLDPTMLLERADWESVAQDSPYRHYLLYFSILDSLPGSDAYVRRVAREKGLRIVRIGSVRDVLKRGFINARHVGPQGFLGLVRDADYVITSSFHGCVFSILFEKQFLCLLNRNDRNSRLETLTAQLGLSGRLVRHVDTPHASEQLPITYEPVRQRLAQKRRESLQFLTTALCEADSAHPGSSSAAPGDGIKSPAE